MLGLPKKRMPCLKVFGICHLWVKVFLEYFEKIPVKGGFQGIFALALS